MLVELICKKKRSSPHCSQKQVPRKKKKETVADNSFPPAQGWAVLRIHHTKKLSAFKATVNHLGDPLSPTKAFVVLLQLMLLSFWVLKFLNSTQFRPLPALHTHLVSNHYGWFTRKSLPIQEQSNPSESWPTKISDCFWVSLSYWKSLVSWDKDGQGSGLCASLNFRQTFQMSNESMTSLLS